MPSEPRRVVVVGGNGYVGGRIVRLLEERGVDVVGTGRAQLDLTRDSDTRLDEVLAGADAVVNCAALNEHDARDDPGRAEEVAVSAASRLGAGAGRCGVARVLQLSTVHVYGPLQGDIDERTPLSPVHPYAAAHARAEVALTEAAPEGVLAAVLRLSNAVGAPVRAEVDRWTLLTNDLARTWAREGRLVLHSAGQEWRDFVGLGDAARAVDHLSTARQPSPVRVVNVCSGRTVQVLDVAERMADIAATITGVRPEVIPGAAAPGSPGKLPFRMSNSSLVGTGFRFRDDIDEELESVLRFARCHFGQQVA